MAAKDKKTTPARRSTANKDTPGAPAQPAAERRAAEQRLQALIEKFASDHIRLVAALRRSLRKRLPAAHEVVYEYRGCFVISFSPSGQGYEGVLALRAGAGSVRLYFQRGKDLPDPEKRLRGSAQTRFIEVDSASTLTRPAVTALIDEAIARSRVPFERSGRGSVVVRSTSATERGNTGPVAKRTASRKKSG